MRDSVVAASGSNIPMSDPIVVVDRLVKFYGARRVIRGVSFSIGEGEVIGLLGPNGSGKSTILRMLAGYIAPSAGRAWVAGIDVTADSLAARGHIGYVPEDAPLYDGMRVSEFLHFMAAVKRVPRHRTRASVNAVAEQLELGPMLRMTIGRLSRGYRQRVTIAQALLNDPPLLIMDEPTNALDAYQVIAVRTVIRSLAGTRTVLVASHVLAEIERVASRVMVLLDGDLLTTDAMAEAGVARQARLRVGGPPPAILATLRSLPGVASAAPESGGTYLVDIAPGSFALSDLARALVAQDFELSELIEVKPDLERVFLDLTWRAGAVEKRAA